MIRCLAVHSAVVVTALIGAGVAAVANASPSDTLDSSCSFELRPPEVVKVSGVDFVTASVAPGHCTLEVTPNESVVCLSIEGEGSGGECGSTTTGPSEARVYYKYRPGATHVVTGRGCGFRITQPHTLCQVLGPVHATL